MPPKKKGKKGLPPGALYHEERKHFKLLFCGKEFPAGAEETRRALEKEEAVGKAEGYRLCGALLRRSQAEEHGITQGLSIKEIVANNAKKKWREKTVAAAAKITLTAGQRLRLLSGLEGLKTKASRPTRCDKLMAFIWAALLNLRRFGYSLLTALLLLPYGIIAALTTCTQSAFISVGEGIEEFAKYNLRSCFGGVPIAEHLSGLWEAIYAFFAMIFGRCMPGRGAYDDEVSLLPEGAPTSSSSSSTQQVQLNLTGITTVQPHACPPPGGDTSTSAAMTTQPANGKKGGTGQSPGSSTRGPLSSTRKYVMAAAKGVATALTSPAARSPTSAPSRVAFGAAPAPAADVFASPPLAAPAMAPASIPEHVPEGVDEEEAAAVRAAIDARIAARAAQKAELSA